MKLVRYVGVSGQRLAAQVGDRLFDPIDIDERSSFLDMDSIGRVASMAAILAEPAAGRAVLEAALARAASIGYAGLPLGSHHLVAPLDPCMILCGGSNYRDHNDEKAASPLKGKEAEFFLKSPTCVIGPGDPIHLDRRVTRKLDYEVELAVVIGKPGRNIPVADALQHVFGYTILNDVTARDRQVKLEPNGFAWYELGKSKNFDTAAPLGPCILTADEVDDPQSLALSTTVNGELRQSGSTASMIRSVAELIAHFSVLLTLHPGTVISTGTPGGTAWASDPELGGNNYHRNDIVRPAGYLRPGDLVACTIEGIGTLSNPVVAGREAPG